MHWGDYSRPYVITAFERDLAGRLSRLGVDLVLGHHHHCLHEVEFFGRMPVLYGLGNIVFDHPRYGEELRQQGADWVGSSRAQLESSRQVLDISPQEQFSVQRPCPMDRGGRGAFRRRRFTEGRIRAGPHRR
jgi:poly-gamma-glutamate synthesis protein (capsule biosynthesis protein)